VRAFDDVEVVHTEMEVDPIRDMGIIYEELLLKDKDAVEKRLEEVKKVLARNGSDKASKDELEVLLKV